MKYDAQQEVEPWSPFVRSLEKLPQSTNDGRGWDMRTRLLCFCFGKEKRLNKAGNHEVEPSPSFARNTVWVTDIGPTSEYINEYGFPSTGPGSQVRVQVPEYRYRKTIMVHMDFENTLESNELDDVLKSK